jgi:uncharacterized protein (DUF362 family)
MRKPKITRRSFNILVGSVAITGVLPIPGYTDDKKPDIAIAHGSDAGKNTRAALDALGGMSHFVKPGQTVDILINFMGRIPAAHTNPEVFRSVVDLAKESGASRVRVISWIEENRRARNNLESEVSKAGAIFHHVPQENPELWQKLEIPRGKYLKEINVFKVLYESDIFIMIPSFKHHGSARHTGAMKLYMGTTPRADNRGKMHAGNSDNLEQAIADLNTAVRPPDLIVVDAMDVLTSNGPSGPGPTTAVNKVVAGRDRVAIDAYCAPMIGLDPQKSVQINAAAELGIGEKNLTSLIIREIEVG